MVNVPVLEVRSAARCPEVWELSPLSHVVHQKVIPSLFVSLDWTWPRNCISHTYMALRAFSYSHSIVRWPLLAIRKVMYIPSSLFDLRSHFLPNTFMTTKQ